MDIFLFQRVIYMILFPFALYQFMKSDEKMNDNPIAILIGYIILMSLSIIPAAPIFGLELNNDNEYSSDEIFHLVYFGFLILIEILIILIKTDLLNKSFNYASGPSKHSSSSSIEKYIENDVDSYPLPKEADIGLPDSLDKQAKMELHDLNIEYIEAWKLSKIEELKFYPRIKSLIIEKSINEITYYDLLNTIHWKFKRIEILLRDNFKCQKDNCGKVSEFNHIHHKYYINQTFPWEYDDNALITLCPSCHKKEHENNRVPVYTRKGNSLVQSDEYSIQCSRCGGVGYFSEYMHVENGVCFKCWGNTVNYNTFYQRLIEEKEKKTNPNYIKKYEKEIHKLDSFDLAYNFPIEISSKYKPIKNNFQDEFIDEEPDDLPF